MPVHLPRDLPALLARIRGEYLEMAGLGLTIAQAGRLFGVDSPTCEEVLEALITARFLSRTDDGRFVVAPTPA
jgi:hypothetical protein